MHITKARLSRVDLLPFAIWLSLMAALFGFGFGLLCGFMSFLAWGVSNGFRYLIVWIFGTPTVFAIIGLISGLLGGLVYNALVKKRGGVMFEFEEIGLGGELPPPPPKFREEL